MNYKNKYLNSKNKYLDYKINIQKAGMNNLFNSIQNIINILYQRLFPGNSLTLENNEQINEYNDEFDEIISKQIAQANLITEEINKLNNLDNLDENIPNNNINRQILQITSSILENNYSDELMEEFNLLGEVNNEYESDDEDLMKELDKLDELDKLKQNGGTEKLIKIDSKLLYYICIFSHYMILPDNKKEYIIKIIQILKNSNITNIQILFDINSPINEFLTIFKNFILCQIRNIHYEKTILKKIKDNLINNNKEGGSSDSYTTTSISLSIILCMILYFCIYKFNLNRQTINLIQDIKSSDSQEINLPTIDYDFLENVFKKRTLNQIRTNMITQFFIDKDIQVEISILLCIKRFYPDKDDFHNKLNDFKAFCFMNIFRIDYYSLRNLQHIIDTDEQLKQIYINAGLDMDLLNKILSCDRINKTPIQYRSLKANKPT